jgi:hypothetical protein
MQRVYVSQFNIMLLLTDSEPGIHVHFYRCNPCNMVTRFACASSLAQGLSSISLQNILRHDVTVKEQHELWKLFYRYTILRHITSRVGHEVT